MIRKDLAYSPEQISHFLLQMEGIQQHDLYTYNAVGFSIRLKAQKQENHFVDLPRSYMYLVGDADKIEAFYKKFMLYHMTMGG